MNTFTIAPTFAVENRTGSTVTLSTADMNAATIAYLLEYGVRQAVNDAGASALAEAYTEETGLSGKDVDEAERKAWGKANPDAVNDMRETLRTERAASLEANVIGTQRAASRHADPLDIHRLAIVLDLIKSAPASATAKAYAKIPAKDQAARKQFRLAWAAEQSDVVDPIAKRMLADADATANALAALEL